ncbi:MAG: hypothetical protein JW395_3919 [Nitrospira sp.]|nr:hypothetical protein [Nitrospira sp.]
MRERYAHHLREFVLQKKVMKIIQKRFYAPTLVIIISPPVTLKMPYPG